MPQRLALITGCGACSQKHVAVTDTPYMQVLAWADLWTSMHCNGIMVLLV